MADVKKIATRDSYGNALVELAAEHDDVVVFDAFDLSDGKKSIAFTITILPTENMSDTDLLALQNSVISSVEQKCGAVIRDK